MIFENVKIKELNTLEILKIYYLKVIRMVNLSSGDIRI